MKMGSLLLFGMIILLCNLHLLTGEPPQLLIFNVQRTVEGEWWRIITHPFVHVSWYHLLVDGATTVILWHQITQLRRSRTALVCLFSLGGSLFASLLFSPYILTSGYCGLSGVAHGLLIYMSLLWWFGWESFDTNARRYQKRRVMGRLLFFLLLVKCLGEMYGGGVAQYHFGNVGIPLAHAHLGGCVAGTVAALLRFFMRVEGETPSGCVN